MPLSLKPLTALALLATATPLFAQEATAPEETPSATETPAAEPLPEADPVADAPAGEAPAADAATGETLDPAATTGEAASAEPQIGQPYLREEIGDWSVRCLRTEDGRDPCQLYQLLADAEGNSVAEISIVALPEGEEAAAGAEIMAPLMTLLTQGLTLSVDGASTRSYPFTFCNEAGCLARVGFTAEELEQFRRGNAAELSLVPALAPDQTVTLNVSLSGFTAGYQAVEAARDARASDQ